MGEEITKLIDKCMRLELEKIKLTNLELLPLSMRKKKFPKQLIEEAEELVDSHGVENTRKQEEEEYEKLLSEIAEIVEDDDIGEVGSQLSKTQSRWLESNKQKIKEHLKGIRV